MSVLPDRLRALFDELGPGLLLAARGWTRSAEEAEDAVQEGFIRFWRHGLDKARDPKAYLFICVRNAATDAGRRELQRRRAEQESSCQAGTENKPLFRDELEQREFGIAVTDALARLPSEQREVLVMKVWGSLTFAQIAEVVDLSPNTVASRYRYAITALRGMLPGEDPR